MPKTKTPILYVYNQSDDPHIWAPVNINGRSYTALGNGTICLSEIVGQKIEDLLVNGVRIPLIVKPIIERNSILHAHVKDKTLKLLTSSAS